MRKLERRAFLCLTLAAVLLAGVITFAVRFVADGAEWATFYGNQSLYQEGKMPRGEVYDRNGILLFRSGDGQLIYNEDQTIREATVHLVGDEDGNIGTSALAAYKDRMVGYNIVTGTYGIGNDDTNSINLTIDAKISSVALEALAGRNGLVAVYNYETGEVICMVSTPTFDPEYPPELTEEDESGIYINKVLSSVMIPGSIFKLVTMAAALEMYPDLDDWSYQCSGTKYMSDWNGDPDEAIRCTGPHGWVDANSALAYSCNCAFATLAEDMGPDIMSAYVEKCGLTSIYDMDGVKNIAGSFEFPDYSQLYLGWAGSGQFNDLINPCSMLVYLGAIAGGGEAAKPSILKSSLPIVHRTGQLISSSTATRLTEMMKNNVNISYGSQNFGGLDIYAKSGTAEVEGHGYNAWFAGFIKNSGSPYAFIVCVEEADDYGSEVAAPVANLVLQAIVFPQ